MIYAKTENENTRRINKSSHQTASELLPANQNVHFLVLFVFVSIGLVVNIFLLAESLCFLSGFPSVGRGRL